VVILGHIIYLPFYYNDIVGFNQSKDIPFSVGREKAQELLKFIEDGFIFTKDRREVKFKPLFETFFIQQIRGLVRQKGMCQLEYDEPAGEEGKGCTAKALVESIAAAFGGKQWFIDELKRQKKIDRTDRTYEWASEEVYGVSARKNPRGTCCSPSKALGC
jgi:hypothetical protein